MRNKIFIYLSLLITSNLYSQQFSQQVQNYINVQDSIVAITNVTIIDGKGGEIKRNKDLLIKGKKIFEIGMTGTIDIPPNSTVIDGTGKTVIPGLIMLHEHLFYAKPFDNSYKGIHMTNTFPKMYLAGGVTNMRTAGSIEANADINIKTLIKEGKILGPDIDVSTPHVERESFIPQLQSLYGNESIESWLSYWIGKGITSVKVYNHITKDDLRKIIHVAHEKGIKVTGHLCSITYREAAELDIDNLEHGFMAATDFVENKKENECVRVERSLFLQEKDSPEMNDLMSFLIQKNVTLTYTPNVFEPLTGRELIPGGGDQALAPYLLEQIRHNHKSLTKSKEDSMSLVSFRREMERMKKFHDMGGNVVVGTDPTGSGRTIAGYSNQRLIELLIETGFNIEEAIKIATLNGANYLEISEKTGSIEAGKEADLVLIDGDLSLDVSMIRKMETVFKDGVGFDSRKIFASVKGKVGLY